MFELKTWCWVLKITFVGNAYFKKVWTKRPYIVFSIATQHSATLIVHADIVWGPTQPSIHSGCVRQTPAFGFSWLWGRNGKLCEAVVSDRVCGLVWWRHWSRHVTCVCHVTCVYADRAIGSVRQLTRFPSLERKLSHALFTMSGLSGSVHIRLPCLPVVK